jgi:hypothetical protein
MAKPYSGLLRFHLNTTEIENVLVQVLVNLDTRMLKKLDDRDKNTSFYRIQWLIATLWIAKIAMSWIQELPNEFSPFPVLATNAPKNFTFNRQGLVFTTSNALQSSFIINPPPSRSIAHLALLRNSRCKKLGNMCNVFAPRR